MAHCGRRPSHAAGTHALAALPEFETQGSSNLVWSWATCAQPNEAASAAAVGQSLAGVAESSHQNPSNVAWNFAICDAMRVSLTSGAAMECTRRPNRLPDSLHGGRGIVQRFAQFVLAVAWSLSFVGMLEEDVYSMFAVSLRQLGKALDAARSRFTEPAALQTAFASLARIRTRSGVRPRVVIHVPGMATIHKPSDWEVDGLGVELGEHPPLSAFVQSLFSRDRCPIVWDVEHNFGFLHRLDIPSSGLILGGTTYEGYYGLRIQLDTHRLQRDYAVLSHGFAHPDVHELVARVDVAPDPSQRKSISDTGKPSSTMVRVEAHERGTIDEDTGNACLIGVRIATGRRHQIRVHMRHFGHPTVADARYTLRELFVASADTGCTNMRRGTVGPAGRGQLRSRFRWTYNL